jgi:hypothetical protein
MDRQTPQPEGLTSSITIVNSVICKFLHRTPIDGYQQATGWGDGLMSKPRTHLSDDTSEINDAASTLFESGLGAHRANDNKMAKLLLGVAQQLWQKGNDLRNAAKARDLYRSVE